MQARWLNRFIAVLAVLSLTTAHAQDSIGPGGSFNLGGGARGSAGDIKQERATCVADDSNGTTYNSAAFQTISYGASSTATQYGVVLVGVLAEDGLATFSVASMTINGITAINIVDQGGTGIVDAAFFRSPVEQGGATVNVSVTFSEPVTSAVVCVWKVMNLQSLTPTSSIADEDTASGDLVLTLPTTTANPSADVSMFGICNNSGTGQTTTWTLMTEREDTASGEQNYSNASITAPGGSTAVVCNWTGANDASGAAVAFR